MAGHRAEVPVRADQRFIGWVAETMLAGKIEFVPAEFDRIARIFNRSGGSWVRLFHGGPRETDLLKEILRRAFKGGLLTRKHTWGL